MPTIKVSIEPVYLEATHSKSSTERTPLKPVCVIQATQLKVSFYHSVDFYQYLIKLITNLPNLPIHKQPELLQDDMPWSENIQVTCRLNLAA